MDYLYHEAASIFPTMTELEASQLGHDIKERGLSEPIILCDNKILDGRNRYEQCRAVGVEPTFVTIECNDPVAYVLSHNLYRRHLTTSQRAMIAARAKEYYTKQARERQAKTRKVGNRPVVAPVPQREQGKSRDHAGASLGVGGRSVDYASHILNSGDQELVRQVDLGEKTVKTAYQEIKDRDHAQHTKADDQSDTSEKTLEGNEKQRPSSRSTVPLRLRHAIGVVKRELEIVRARNWRGVNRQDVKELLSQLIAMID